MLIIFPARLECNPEFSTNQAEHPTLVSFIKDQLYRKQMSNLEGHRIFVNFFVIMHKNQRGNTPFRWCIFCYKAHWKGFDKSTKAVYD